MSVTSYYLAPKGQVTANVDENAMGKALTARDGLLWLDVIGPTADDADLLARVFGFHHLALADCLSDQVHAPKIDDFGDYLFMIVHGINYEALSDIVETTELCLFLGDRFVVTTHRAALYSIDAVTRLVERDGRPMTRGAGFLVHVLIDALVDNIRPSLDKLGEIADDIEEEAIRNPQHPTLEALLKLKQSTLRLNRIVSPQREIVNRLSRGDFPVIGQDERIYYRNIYDHMLQIDGMNQILRERSDIALSTYLSAMANRQNETMKALAIIASIFLPLTLLAGIYGMNFENIPELDVSWAYFAVIGFMGAVALGAMAWFWSKRWITWGRAGVSRVRPFVVEPHRVVDYVGNLAMAAPAATKRAGKRWLPSPFKPRKGN